jgi:hypothetical protein
VIYADLTANIDFCFLYLLIITKKGNKMEEVARDVQPFLFNPRDVQKVLLFPELIKQAKL